MWSVTGTECGNSFQLTFWHQWEIEQHNLCRMNPLHTRMGKSSMVWERLLVSERARIEQVRSINIIVINWCCHFQWHLIVVYGAKLRRYCARACVDLFHLHLFASLFFESGTFFCYRCCCCLFAGSPLKLLFVVGVAAHAYNHHSKQICAFNEHRLDSRLSERWQQHINENIHSWITSQCDYEIHKRNEYI